MKPIDAEAGSYPSAHAKRLLVGLVAVAAVVLMAGASPTICGSCGHENPAGRARCSHCEAALPDRAPATPDTGTVSGVEDKLDVADGRIPDDTVSGEIEQARMRFQDGDVDIARLFCRNALALNLLTTPGTRRDERAGAIMQLIDACERGGRSTERKCPQCQGSGKGVLDVGSISSRETVQVAAGRCRRCEGSGVVRGQLTIDELRFARGQAGNRYRVLQQARGRVPVGLSWVPDVVAGRLSVTDAVALKRALGVPCSDCEGFGRCDCEACRGQGRVACTAKNCRNGEVETESGGKLGGKALLRKVKCTVCGGDGLIACDRCNGVGGILCRGCGGTGVAKACSRCVGQGLVDCTRCAKTGVYRGKPCPHCHGGGVSECPSCGGTGCRR